MILEGDSWSGVKNTEWRVANPSEAEVIAAVSRLNGADATQIILTRDESYISVAGGPTMYVVYVEMPDGSFLNLLSGSDEDGTTRLVCGGQTGDFPLANVVGIEKATGAVLQFIQGFPDGITDIWEIETPPSTVA